MSNGNGNGNGNGHADDDETLPPLPPRETRVTNPILPVDPARGTILQQGRWYLLYNVQTHLWEVHEEGVEGVLDAHANFAVAFSLLRKRAGY